MDLLCYLFGILRIYCDFCCITNSNNNNININKKFFDEIIIVNIITGTTIASVLVKILAVPFLVLYSSSILIISNLLLIFNAYLFINGIFIYVKYILSLQRNLTNGEK